MPLGVAAPHRRRLGRRRSALVFAVGAPLTVTLGLLLALFSLHPLILSIIAFTVGTLVIEMVRWTVGRHAPWWIAHVAIIPWMIIVLIPWSYFSVAGSWQVLGSEIDRSLSETWVFHLLALAGMILGSVVGMVLRSPRPNLYPAAVRWSRLSAFLLLALGVTAASMVLAQRPLSSLWRLSGAVRYFDEPARVTPLSFLDYASIVAQAALLFGTAVRRRRLRRPPAVEVVFLLVLTVLALGSGGRGRLYFLVLGWLSLQFGPDLAARSGSALKRIAVAVGGVAVLVLAIPVAEEIGGLRSRATSTASLPETAVADIDVLRSAQFLFERGAYPGMLGGRSYSEFVVLVVPRRFAGESKPTPSADRLVRTLIDPSAGAAAPLWIESALNFGKSGVFLFAAVYAWILVRGLRSLQGSRIRFLATLPLLGPLWIFVSFLCLSRLTLLQALLTMGSIVVAAALASRAIVWRRRYDSAAASEGTP